MRFLNYLFLIVVVLIYFNAKIKECGEKKINKSLSFGSRGDEQIVSSWTSTVSLSFQSNCWGARDRRKSNTKEEYIPDLHLQAHQEGIILIFRSRRGRGRSFCRMTEEVVFVVLFLKRVADRPVWSLLILYELHTLRATFDFRCGNGFTEH